MMSNGLAPLLHEVGEVLGGAHHVKMLASDITMDNDASNNNSYYL